MRIVSPLLKKLVYPTLALTGAFRWTSTGGLAVVTYHGVLPHGYSPVDSALDGSLIRPDVLQRQLRLLKQHYNLISPEEFLDSVEKGSALPARAVLVTCDDGLLNCLTDMLPVLQQEDVKCLFFVTGASTEESRTTLWYEDLYLIFLKARSGPFEISSEKIVLRGQFSDGAQRRLVWWDWVKRLSQIDGTTRNSVLTVVRKYFGLEMNSVFVQENPAATRRYGLLTCNELRQLISAGMTIGAHTLTHPMLSQLTTELAYKEIAGSGTRLESALQKRIWAFAYPFGDPQSVTPEVQTMPQKAGYKVAFLNFGGGLGSALPLYAAPRIHVTAGMSLSEFEAHVSGFYARTQRYTRRAFPLGSRP
ncbi:MAG TPA: polysaccharide deacetylase family protein [Candidatus Sulfotelmatobacter sp.]|nr:polysaccharide deacetylase family protein [Candidatus Sulfotelmatobacter sp.]